MVYIARTRKTPYGERIGNGRCFIRGEVKKMRREGMNCVKT